MGRGAPQGSLSKTIDRGSPQGSLLKTVDRSAKSGGGVISALLWLAVDNSILIDFDNEGIKAIA